MSKTIWKYPLDFPECTIAIPKGGRIVYVDLQGGEPMLWIEVIPGVKLDLRRFIVYGTGHLIPNHHKHVGSYQMPPFVWHIHEIIEVEE